MRVKYQQTLTALGAAALLALAPPAHGAIVSPVTGWAVHNGSTSITDANTDSPLLTPADDFLVVMVPTTPVTLAQANDYIKFTANVELNERTAQTGTAFLNTQLRYGLFSGPNGAVSFEDAPNIGFFGQYANAGQGWARLYEQETAGVNPFLSGTLLTSGVADPEGDAIEGANPPVISYSITITRNANGKLDIAGEISGGDYLSTFSLADHESASFPAGGPFKFNRAGLYFGPNVNATDAQVSNAAVETNVPEPQSICLALTAAVGSLVVRSRRRHASSQG
jgi:hypothetical protein